MLELWAPTVLGYLGDGGELSEVAAKFESVPLRAQSVVAVDDIDLPDGPERDRVIENCHRLCGIAQTLRCRNIQMVSGVTFSGLPWPDVRRETARGLRQMADIAAEYGLMVSYEPLAWRTVWGVSQGLEIMQEAGRSNVGLLVDAFHAFAAGDDIEAIRKLDPGVIATVHLGDALARQGDAWADEDRTAMPGDGIVPIAETMRAVLDTGYAGLISDEVFPDRFGDWGPTRIARTLKGKADSILGSL